MANMFNRNVYIVLFVVGLALIAWGFNEHGMFGNKLARSLGGGISNKVMILWIAGGAASIYGGLGLFKK